MLIARRLGARKTPASGRFGEGDAFWQGRPLSVKFTCKDTIRLRPHDAKLLAGHGECYLALAFWKGSEIEVFVYHVSCPPAAFRPLTFRYPPPPEVSQGEMVLQLLTQEVVEPR